ncbi:3081_t:CDS:1, partial [Dentiscutata heterogama]
KEYICFEYNGRFSFEESLKDEQNGAKTEYQDNIVEFFWVCL